MVFEEKRRLRVLLVLGLTGFGLVGCTSTPDDSSGSTGTTSSGGASTSGGSDKSDSTVSRGGSSSSSKASSARGGKSSSSSKSSNNTQESGGSVSDGGTDSGGDANSSGGAEPEGSSTTSTGGSTRAQTTTGKSGNGGTSSSSETKNTGAGGKKDSSSKAAGGSGTGGKSASSGSTATGGMGTGGKVDSGGATNTSSGGCQKGQVKASEVIIMGESFYAWTGTVIQKRVEANAKKAGAIGSGDSYRNVAISGQGMSVVAGEYDTALKAGAVKVVIMDGGGIDCMNGPCDTCPGIFKTLLTKMASNGVIDVIYTRYPEPGNPPGSNTNLKKNLDILMPKMEEVCKAATGLRCHWVDLRPVWVNGDTSDGLHPTQSGGDHCGDAIWDKMVKECIAQ